MWAETRARHRHTHTHTILHGYPGNRVTTATGRYVQMVHKKTGTASSQIHNPLSYNTPGVFTYHLQLQVGLFINSFYFTVMLLITTIESVTEKGDKGPVDDRHMSKGTALSIVLY